MEKRKLGRTDLEVSVLGFGAAPAAYLKADAERVVKLLNHMLDEGLNLIDTAASYPGSEEFIGDHFAGRRKDFVLVSKCGNKLNEIDAPPFSYELVAASVDRSLRLLKTDALDVMLLHSCDLATLKQGEALRALFDAQHAGKIRHVGYSGDNEAAAWAAEQENISVVETSINIADQINIDTLLPIARENNVGVIAKRPIANAAWKDISQQPGMYGSYAKTYTQRFAEMKLDLVSLGFAGDPMQAWPEIALRFTLGMSGVCSAIIGTTNPANAKANIAAAKKGALPEKAVRAIRDAFAIAKGDALWSGQT